MPRARLRRGEQCRVMVEGVEKCMAFLGQGAFCKAYHNNAPGEDQKVYCFVTHCYLKEGIALWGQKSPHIPVIEKIENRDDGVQVYRMPYYEPLTAKHKAAWQQYKVLNALWIDCLNTTFWTNRRGAKLPDAVWLYDAKLRFLSELQGKVPDSLYDALDDLINVSSNYGGGITFDFTKNNFSVQDDGTLILRDVLFDPEALNKVRQKQ